MLHIFDEVHSKEYKIPMAASKRVLDVKTDMFHCSDIPVNQQIWAGWPNSCTSDDLTLGQLGLTVPVHELSFRAAPVLVSSGQRKKSSRVRKCVRFILFLAPFDVFISFRCFFFVRFLL